MASAATRSSCASTAGRAVDEPLEALDADGRGRGARGPPLRARAAPRWRRERRPERLGDPHLDEHVDRRAPPARRGRPRRPPNRRGTRLESVSHSRSSPSGSRADPHLVREHDRAPTPRLPIACASRDGSRRSAPRAGGELVGEQLRRHRRLRVRGEGDALLVDEARLMRATLCWRRSPRRVSAGSSRSPAHSERPRSPTRPSGTSASVSGSPFVQMPSGSASSASRPLTAAARRAVWSSTSSVVLVAPVRAHLLRHADGQREHRGRELPQHRGDVVARPAGVEVARGGERRPAVVERDQPAEDRDRAVFRHVRRGRGCRARARRSGPPRAPGWAA